MTDETKVLQIAPQWSRFIGNKQNDNAEKFFTHSNKLLLHRFIIQEVYKKTDGRAAIGKQSDSELQIVMVNTIQSAYNVHLSVVELNKKVTDYCVKNILQNIGFYMQYLKDVNQAPDETYGGMRGSPLDKIDITRPENTRTSREAKFKQMF